MNESNNKIIKPKKNKIKKLQKNPLKTHENQPKLQFISNFETFERLNSSNRTIFIENSL